jgi:hypothetical protein
MHLQDPAIVLLEIHGVLMALVRKHDKWFSVGSWRMRRNVTGK